MVAFWTYGEEGSTGQYAIPGWNDTATESSLKRRTKRMSEPPKLQLIKTTKLAGNLKNTIREVLDNYEKKKKNDKNIVENC